MPFALSLGVCVCVCVEESKLIFLCWIVLDRTSIASSIARSLNRKKQPVTENEQKSSSFLSRQKMHMYIGEKRNTKKERNKTEAKSI